MSTSNAEQATHDRINLGRLVKRIENTAEDDWNQAGGTDLWIKAQGTLQKIRHARRLLKNVEADDMDISSKSAQWYRDMRIALDRTEKFVSNIEKQSAPKPIRPASILSTIPAPTPPTPSFDKCIPEPPLLPPVISPISPTISAPSQPTKSTAITTPAFTHNSQALQQELSDQLAQMATQLKRNAVHFSESLSKDKAVVQETQEKLESNHDIMTRERIRVRDLRGKTGGTTCLVVMSVVAVLVAFIFMVLIIRAT